MANIARQGNEIVLKLSAGERIDEPIRRIQGLKPRNFKFSAGTGRAGSRRGPSSTGPCASCCSPR